MAKIVLIGCSAKKSKGPAPARDLYQGDLFKKSLAYANKILKPKTIFVLSAKHGLVPLDKRLVPYDCTLKTMPARERKAWGQKVLKELQKETDIQKDSFVILAGKSYYQYLLGGLTKWELPLDDMRIGERLRFLKNAL
jgi:hypothetical protein